MVTTDFLIIGGGIIGISVARELKRRWSDSRVTIIEKETDCGSHASSRNSGVLHAGFYYSPDSLKAKFSQQGNRLLSEYCESKKIAINKCGKLVVATCDEDLGTLSELFKRGAANGIPLHEMSAEEAKEIEPRVKVWKRALFSPTTSTVDPAKIVHAMTLDAITEGVEVQCGVRYLKRRGRTLLTSSGLYQAGYVVNAAGLYADRIAGDFGFAERYRILPFKGLYLYSDEPVGSLRTNVYPVPDLRNPFLGVHFTVTVDGHIKIGPTAIPALWREQYQGWENFVPSECGEILFRMMELAWGMEHFLTLGLEELKKYSRLRMVSMASALVEGMRLEDYRRWGRPGIRAQLVDVKKKRLEMDFVVEGDRSSIHVLNAVSPGFTCAIPFAQYVCETMDTFVH